MSEQSDAKAAFDLEWYEDGKLKRIRIGRVALVFPMCLLTAVLKSWPIMMWQALEKLLR
jgi:hypothetical protein